MNVDRADTFLQRARGLGGRRHLPPGEALLIPRCRSVHTVTMRFALDLIWLDSAGRVVRVDRAVGRLRFRCCLRARSVLECHAGEAGRFLAEPRRMAELAQL